MHFPKQRHYCVSTHQWNNILNDVLNTDKNIVMHTIIVPPNFDYTNENIKTAKITQVRSYKLEAGALTDTLNHPAEIFEANIEMSLLPENIECASMFTVVDPSKLNKICSGSKNIEDSSESQKSVDQETEKQ